MKLTSCWNCSAGYSLSLESCPACGATNANHDLAQAEREEACPELIGVSHKPTPQIPPPVWDSRPINASDAMAAVRAMCGGGHG